MDYIRRLNNKVMTNKVFPIPKEKLKDNVLHKFCGETSLPGWPYLNREMSQVWKMIWIVFLLAACGTSVYVLVTIPLCWGSQTFIAADHRNCFLKSCDPQEISRPYKCENRNSEKMGLFDQTSPKYSLQSNTVITITVITNSRL